MPRIQGLPPELETVPAERDAWRAWRDQVHAYRIYVRSVADHDPEEQALEWAKCRDSCTYWMAIYGEIYEPRTRTGRAGWQPAIPYPFQVDFVDWFYTRLRDNDVPDGAVSKARDMGMSWTFCFLAAHGWQFIEPCSPLLISRKEEQVDSRRMGSLFWKISKIVTRQPKWLQPRGFDWEKHKTRLLIENPENGNQIFGESTTAKAGRGDRATWAGIDEFAMVDDGMEIWGNLGSTTDHRFALSSEHFDYGDHHWRLWHDMQHETPEAVVELDWWLHPEHDEEWYARERRRYEQQGDLNAFHREVERNPRAGSDLVYPVAGGTSTGDYPYDATLGRVYCAIDPGIRDDTAIVWIQHDPGAGRYRVVESYTNQNQPAAYYAALLKGVHRPDFDLHAHDVAEWTALLTNVAYVGDPAGGARGANGESFYDILKKEHGITVRITNKKRGRTHRGRHEALMGLYPKLDFHDGARARRVLEAVQRHRRAPMKEGAVHPSEKHAHDRFSHLVSALEFFAVNLEEMRSLEGMSLAPWDPKQAKPATHLWRVA